MICQSYSNLSHTEKIVFTGELLHAAMVHEGLFLEACELINKAVKSGIMDKVKILPNRNEEVEY